MPGEGGETRAALYASCVMTGSTAALLAGVAGVLGLVIGSFLNVVIHRVPQRQSIVTPRSRCPGCGAEIRPRDNVPVLSWLLLRGRCRHCHRPIGARYPLVELATAALFAGVALRFRLSGDLPAYLYLAAIAVALAVIDLDVRRLPDVIVLPSYVVAALLLGAAALGHHDFSAWLRAVEAMAACYGGFFALAFIYPAGMGFGDVKLAGVLGLYLGYLGWGAVALGMFGAFLLGGLTGIAMVLSRRANRKSALPFGPFMLTAAFVAVFAARPLISAYLHLTGV